MTRHSYNGKTSTARAKCLCLLILCQVLLQSCKLVASSACSSIVNADDTVTFDLDTCIGEVADEFSENLKYDANDNNDDNEIDGYWMGGGITDFIKSAVRNLAGTDAADTEERAKKFDFDKLIDKDANKSAEEMMEEARQMAKAMVGNLMGNDHADGLINRVFNNRLLKDIETVMPKGDNLYEYPPLERLEPGEVGEVKLLQLDDGAPKHKVITRAINPPLFEVPGFITDEEADYIIGMSEKKGLVRSGLFSDKAKTENRTNVGIARKSFSTFLDARKNDLDEAFIGKIYERISRLLKLPIEVIRWSETLAIGRYHPGEYYHAHLDSTMPEAEFPCCFQKTCPSNANGTTGSNLDCCRLCRYATVLYYLSDVEEGGATAFPVADYKFSEIIDNDQVDWRNLSHYCDQSSVLVKPEKGKAIVWYNHKVTSKGYLGAIDTRSYHGGCDVIKGTKWIATNWITTPLYEHRYLPSKFREDYDTFDTKDFL